MYRARASYGPLNGLYMARSADTSNTLGYRESLINYANDLRTTAVYPILSLSLLSSRRNAQSRHSPFALSLSLAYPILRSLLAEMLPVVFFLCLSFPFSLSLRVPSIFILPTQLARLFIKTSKLTGFNRVRFTLFVALVYYLLRYKQHSLALLFSLALSLL